LKTRTPLIAGIGLFICFTALCVTALLAGKHRNLLLTLPNGTGSPGINVFSAQEFSEDEFPLTYEIPYSGRISLSYAEFSVTLIGTSGSYPQIMGHSMAEGSFFSNQAWKEKLKHAVLNEQAAFSIFGSIDIAGSRFRIRNDTWIVTGVIKDGYDEQVRVYIPSSVQGGETNALAMTISGSLDETFMKNRLKSLKVMDSDFDFINFNVQISLLWERTAVLLLCFAGFFLVSLYYPMIIAFKKSWKVLRSELDRSYSTEILKNNKKLIIVNILPVFGLAVLSILTVILFINAVSVCLPWQDIPSINRNYLTFFYPHLESVYTLELISRVIFIAAAVITAFFFAVLNVKINKYFL